MLFKLKNVEATYQCLINKVFIALIRKIMDVYMDDMELRVSKKLIM